MKRTVSADVFSPSNRELALDERALLRDLAELLRELIFDRLDDLTSVTDIADDGRESREAAFDVGRVPETCSSGSRGALSFSGELSDGVLHRELVRERDCRTS